jgi:hypothetical protein
LISGAYFYASAQPTWDFDTPAWTGSGASTEPAGWISENAAVLPPLYNNPQSVFRATTPDIHGGTYAMKLTSVTMTSNPAPGQLPNPIGLAATGVVNLSPPSLKFGFPYASRPNMISFWYKYSPMASDTAECFVSLWNGVTHDTIAYGFWKTGATVGTYTQQNITLTYDPSFSTEFPDSMAVIFSSTILFNANYSLCMNCGQAGSNLYVDDITFSGWNGINEHPAANDVIVYPNPASAYVTIIADVNEASSVIVYDVTGKAVSSASLNQAMNGMNRKESVVNASALSSGVYSYSIADKNGISLRNGKLSIVH